MSPGADHAERAAELLRLAWSEDGYAEASEAFAEAQVHATLAVWAALTAITDRKERPVSIWPKPPTVPVKRVEATTGGIARWVIDCPWCGREHSHGAGRGHRVSHCRDADGVGYVIAKIPTPKEQAS